MDNTQQKSDTPVQMLNVETLQGILARPQSANLKLVIRVERPGSVGGSPCVAIEGAHLGFDWDSGKLMFYPAQPLTALTPEQLTEIHESLKLGQSWHANEAYRALRHKCDGFRADAERHRFGRDLMTNTSLQNSLAPLLDAWVNSTPEAITAADHDAQADHMIAVARNAGLWPLKTEGATA